MLKHENTNIVVSTDTAVKHAKHAKHAEHAEHPERPLQSPHVDPNHESVASMDNVQHAQFICYELGALSNDSEKLYFEENLTAYGISVQAEKRQIEQVLGHWVFIPPLRSKALGRLKLEEIKLKGIKDVVLLTKNEPKYAISLGVFNDLKYANRRLHKLQSLGFNAEIGIRKQPIEQDWLLIKTSVKNDLDEAGWASLIKNYPEIHLSMIQCK